jgi:alkylhydroperoxidase family enzyme
MQPRLEPVPESEWSDETRALMTALAQGFDRPLNVFTTLAHHPDLMRRWLRFATHVLVQSTLSARDRELAILRTAWNRRSGYEWGQHISIARQAGLGDDEIARVADGPDAEGWRAYESTVLRVVDELCSDGTIGDSTWTALVAQYDSKQILDLLFLVGQYSMLAMVLSSARVERDDGLDEHAAGVVFPPEV